MEVQTIYIQYIHRRDTWKSGSVAACKLPATIKSFLFVLIYFFTLVLSGDNKNKVTSYS